MAIIEAIATTYLEAEASSVTFSSIPSTYEHLQIRMSARNTFNYPAGVPNLTFNGVTSSVYSTFAHNANASSPAGFRTVGQAYIRAPMSTTGNGVNNYIDRLNTGDYGPAVIDIFDYRNADTNTTVMADSATALTHTSPYISFASGLFDDKTVITSITLGGGDGNWMRGSRFSLYGLKSS